MSKPARLRRLYDVAEREVTPRLKELLQDEGLLARGGMLSKIRRKVRDRLDKTAERFWHRFNLPAGTDVQQLRQQIGEMDRELRRLRLQLERQEREQKADGKSASERGGRS